MKCCSDHNPSASAAKISTSLRRMAKQERQSEYRTGEYRTTELSKTGQSRDLRVAPALKLYVCLNKRLLG